MDYFWSLALIVIVAVVFLNFVLKRTTVLEYGRGLKYTRGRFKSVMKPGQYWYMPYFTHVHALDIRPRFVSITGQEVLSSDGVTIKVSLAANYEIIDPNIAINKVENFREALYLELQLALREIISAEDIDSVLSGRDEISKRLMKATSQRATDLGLRLISVDLKDIMFSGKLKDVFAQVVSARKEGLAALERARGESAALRHLANAAKMFDGNPNLMQLRLMQAFSEASGNTLVLGVPSQSIPVPVRKADDMHERKRRSTGESHQEGD